MVSDSGFLLLLAAILAGVVILVVIIVLCLIYKRYCILTGLTVFSINFLDIKWSKYISVYLFLNQRKNTTFVFV